MATRNLSDRLFLQPESIQVRTLWLLVTLLVVFWQGPSFTRSLYPGFYTQSVPPRTIISDFYQDWASARNFLTGRPVYEDIDRTIESYLGLRLPENWPESNWRVNAHPPPSVLSIVPLAWLDYPNAFLLWNLISIGALAACLWLLARQLSIGVSVWSLLPVVTLLLVWEPFRWQVTEGQINLVLLLMLTIIWAAARSGWSWIPGVILGGATSIKLFPGLLFIYFLLRRRWTVLISAGATLCFITIISVAILGPETYHAYVMDVLPESRPWLSRWGNRSLVGFWFKLFDPMSVAGAGLINPLWRSPIIARVTAIVSCAVLLSLMGRVILRARSRPDLDKSFGLTVTAMLLVSPITWGHYLVLLILPLAITWAYLNHSGIAKWTWIVIVVALFIPIIKMWGMFIPAGVEVGANVLQTLTVLSFHCYAVLGLFVLQSVRTGVNISEAGGDHLYAN